MQAKGFQKNHRQCRDRYDWLGGTIICDPDLPRNSGPTNTPNNFLICMKIMDLSGRKYLKISLEELIIFWRTSFFLF
jgi:hypothetical protein